ncbi:hypothetical protein G3O08_08630 [Cryomorpha ignava]|uniref:Toxin-antitoxin system YwqK family antitoxin n=1 Tax=Cryomorpha ignava TaxID=101383 RepID=A0A7K3WQ00_9FLAO|nr:hypothetical protein [Cryomorpha ignava]NEN23564.1 hypothetical protein [Cryomorpha ignava]
MRIFYLFIIVFLSIACTHTSEGQNDLNDKKQTPKMETFNIKKFDQNKDADETYRFEREDGAIVTQFGDSESGYFDYARFPNELFEDRKGYYPDGVLKIHGLMYYNQFQKGVWKYYDHNGKLERTIDYDEPFSYTWEDVLEFCDEKKINLLKNTTRISRNTIENKPKWTIEWQIGTAESLEITIDGESGEIINQTTIELDKG